MAEEPIKELTAYDQFIAKLEREREMAIAYQFRRHEPISENYTLYRDTVQINRLTQRQAVNIPLMKETIKTLLSEIDEAPDIEFKNQDNWKKSDFQMSSLAQIPDMTYDSLEAEYTLNEYWNYEMERVDMENLDIQDKKNVLLCGRSFMKLNFLDGLFEPEVMDFYDVVVDPKMKPHNLDSARYVIHQNIYKALNDILANDKYSEEGKSQLKDLMLSQQGLILGNQNKLALDQKKERMVDMGVEDQERLEDLFMGADVIVSLTEHYTLKWNATKKKYEKYVVVLAQDGVILYEETLMKTLGVDFWPFVTWASDLDVSDVWTDGEADIVRVINKVLNAWISQGSENRTLRNWGMRFYDTTTGFNPQTFTPEPFGFYPVPGDPNKILKDVSIPDMKDSLPEMEFLIRLIEKATATPAGEKGVSEKKQITLGEIQMVLGKASERVKGMAKFYRRARKEFAEKWFAIIDANVAPSESVTLFKMSSKGQLVPKEVKRNDWKSKAGYRVRATSTSEQEAEDTQGIQKLIAIKGQFPNNPVLGKILEKRLLEMGDVNPEEIKEILGWEEQQLNMMQQIPQPAMGQPTPQPVSPQPETMPEEALKLKGSTQRLRQLATTI